MPTLLKSIQRKSLQAAGSLAATLLLSTTLLAQTPQPRITSEIDNSQRAIVPGTHPPMARPELDAGRVPAATKLEGITIVFSRSVFLAMQQTRPPQKQRHDAHPYRAAANSCDSSHGCMPPEQSLQP